MADQPTEFQKANEAIHKVEDQWHYPILAKAGFVAITKEAKGFSRSYKYSHPDGREVRCTTGASADYWSSSDNHMGFWSDLQPYLDGKD